MRTKPGQKLAETSRGRAVPPVETPSDHSSADASCVPVQTPSLEGAASSEGDPNDRSDVNTESEVNLRGVVRSDSNNNASKGAGKAPMRSPSYKKSLGRKKLSAVKRECSATNTMPVSVRSLVARRRPADVQQCRNPCKMPRATKAKPKEVRQQAVAQLSQATSEPCDPGMVCTYCGYVRQLWHDQHMSCAPPVPQFQPCQLCCQCSTSPQRRAKKRKQPVCRRPTPSTCVGIPRYYGPCAPICRGHCIASYAASRPVCPTPSAPISAPRQRAPKAKKARKGK